MHRDATARASRLCWVWPVLTLGVWAGADRVHAAPPVQSPGADAAAPSEHSEQPEPEPEPQTAAEWYARGITLGQQGDNEAAAEAFLRSYELQPTSEALYNAALAHENAEDFVTAIATYRRFLAEPEPSPSLVPVAERSIQALLPKIGALKGVRYEQHNPPQELLVNGEPVALDAFPLLLAPGELRITVVDGQGTARDERYELLAGESLVLDLRALLPEPEPEPTPESEPLSPISPEPEVDRLEQSQRDAARAQRLRRASFALTGVAGAAGIGAIVVGALAADARRQLFVETCYEFEDGICPPGFDIGDPGFHNRNYERLALATTSTASVAAGFAVGALVTGLVSWRLAKRAKHTGLAEHEARVRLAPRPGGLVLRF